MQLCFKNKENRIKIERKNGKYTQRPFFTTFDLFAQLEKRTK